MKKSTKTAPLLPFSTLFEAAAATLEQRKERYGDILDTFESTAAIWTGLLRAHYGPSLPELPVHVASAMMAGIKLGRLCRPFPFNYDDGLDAVNYTEAAHRSKQTKDIAHE